MSRDFRRYAKQAPRARDPLEAFKETCMQALFKYRPSSAAIAVAYVLLCGGNRDRFRVEDRFITWPSHRRLMEDTSLPNGTLADALNWLQRVGFCREAEPGKRPGHTKVWEVDRDFPLKVPAHRNFKVPAGTRQSSGNHPPKFRPTGNDLLITTERVRARVAAPHRASERARTLTAPPPNPLPVGEGASAGSAAAPPACAALPDGYAQAGGVTALSQEGNSEHDPPADIPHRLNDETAANYVQALLDEVQAKQPAAWRRIEAEREAKERREAEERLAAAQAPQRRIQRLQNHVFTRFGLDEGMEFLERLDAGDPEALRIAEQIEADLGQPRA